MASKQDIGFGNPAMLIAPDIAVQQAQLDRQRQFADALRQQSLDPIDAGRGSISWTQGLAKLAQGLASRSLYKKWDMKQADLSRQYAAALRHYVGGGDPVPVASGAGAAPGGSPAPAPVDARPTIDLPGRGPVPLGQPQPGASQPDAQVASAPQQQQSPWALTGNADTDTAMLMMNPDKYGEAVIAAHSPTDYAKTLMLAGVQPGTPQFVQGMQAYATKESHIPIETARGNSWSNNPMTGKTNYYPSLPEGSKVIFDGSGNVIGVRGLDGVLKFIGDVEGAKAGAKASAEAPYGVVQGYNNDTQQPVLLPKSAVTGGGGAGPIQGAFGGVPTGPPLGVQAAANTYGTGSANQFNELQAQAADVPNTMFVLNNMGQIIDQGLKTGPARNRLRELATSIGLPWILTDNAAEFNKNAAQFIARTAPQLGLSGSDARLNMTVHATPNGSMPTGALRKIISQQYGIVSALGASASAGHKWAQSHGANDWSGFMMAWRKNYDPQMFEVMQWSPKARETWLRQHPQQAAQYHTKFEALADMGAF